MNQQFLRPSFISIVGYVADEFGVTVKAIYSFERAKPSDQAKLAVALLAAENHYGVSSIARAMSRENAMIYSMIQSAQCLVRTDAVFKGKVKACRQMIIDNRVPKPKTPPAAELEKLETNKEEILKLRQKEWSLNGICRRFELSPNVVAPVIGVFLVER